MANETPHNAAANPLRILLVEDHLDEVNSLAELLRARGHIVSSAINGFAALAEVRAFRPQVLIVDMRLPDMTGIDVARQLKSDPNLAGLRIIAHSGSPEYRQKAKADGLLEFVLKPATIDVWQALLEGEAGKRAPDNAQVLAV